MMAGKRLIVTVETHTQGEPTRLVIGGVIHYRGRTMREKQAYATRHLDSIRKSLMSEPRGHADMYGGFITPPATETGDLGILFMDNQGFMDMCGHGTIGLCTAVVELGLVPMRAPRTEIQIDTPVGRVQGYAITENGRVVRAGFLNIPSFCTSVNEPVEVDGLGQVDVGIAYGGNFFGILPAEAVGLTMHLDNLVQIREVGMRIKAAINAQIEVRHPQYPEVTGVNILTFYGPPRNPKATYQNVHVFSDGQVDRSPGGTGTSAVMAYLAARGELDTGQSVLVEGLAGGLFGGQITKTWQDDGLVKHIPEIFGSAFVSGIGQFILDPADPMLEGIQSR